MNGWIGWLSPSAPASIHDKTQLLQADFESYLEEGDKVILDPGYQGVTFSAALPYPTPRKKRGQVYVPLSDEKVRHPSIPSVYS